jgi:hypothetical protein
MQHRQAFYSRFKFQSAPLLSALLNPHPNTLKRTLEHTLKQAMLNYKSTTLAKHMSSVGAQNGGSIGSVSYDHFKGAASALSKNAAANSGRRPLDGAASTGTVCSRWDAY